MVADSKQLLKELEQYIYSNVIGHRSAFQVSDVKQDGTVIVRFRSVHTWSAMELTESFCKQLTRLGKDFVQTDDNRVRLPLSRFE